MGTLINVGAIILGSLIGFLVKGRFPEKLGETVMHGVGLMVLLLGLQMALETKQPLAVLLSLVLGGMVGELLDLEGGLERFSRQVEARLAAGQDGFARGFVAASLLYCVGPMAIMGSFESGLAGNHAILINKAFLDGISSIALSASLGLGVVFSSVPVLLYQGALTLLAGAVKQVLTQPVIAEMTATGGLLIMAIGFNMLRMVKIRVANLLPALGVIILLVLAAGR